MLAYIIRLKPRGEVLRTPGITICVLLLVLWTQARCVSEGGQDPARHPASTLSYAAGSAQPQARSVSEGGQDPARHPASTLAYAAGSAQPQARSVSEGIPTLAYAAGSSVRVALVSTATGPTANSLLDLAQAKVSSERGIELLDRQDIARILQEQKLSLSGLVDANTAATAGKLLGVNLFAVVDVDPMSKDALGLVVYDAGTGIKLYDGALPAGKIEEQVNEIAAGVRRGAERERGGLKGLRPVCFLSVRNADLPRSQDAMAQTVGFLLERQLLGSPNLALLERKRLDWVNKEKSLPTQAQHKELLASLVLVDVEISRAADGKGIRATAFLSDNQGKQLGKVHAEETNPAPDTLTAKLQSAMLKHLQADPPAKAPDLRRESKRFHLEGKRLASQKEWHSATQALEAAFALDPSQSIVRSDLARNIGMEGLVLAQPNGVISTPKKLPIPGAKLKASMRLALRAIDLRSEALHKLPTKKVFSLQPYSVQFRDAPNHFQVMTFTKAADDAWDAEAKDLFDQLRTQFRQLYKDELAAWAEVAREDSLSDRPGGAFQYFMRAIQQARTDLRDVQTEDELNAFLLPSFRTWIEIGSVPRTEHANHLLTQFCQQDVPTREAYANIYEGMIKHPHPLMKLYGRWHVLRLGMQTQKMAAGQAQIAYQELRQSAFKLLQDFQPGPRKAIVPQDDPRANYYHFLFFTVDHWPYPNPEQKYQERFALANFMLDRQDVVATIVLKSVQNEFKKQNYAQRWDLIDKATTLLKAGKFQFVDYTAPLPGWLDQEQKRILKERPEFAQKLAPASPVWSRADLLVGIKDNPGIQQLGVPLIDGDSVYVAAAGAARGEISLHLLKISLKDKKPRMLGKALLRTVPVDQRYPVHAEITACCLGKDEVFVGTRTDGIFVFGKDGGPGRHLAKDFPSQECTALAYHDGKLYAAMPGYLLAVDPAAGTHEVLASSRRRDRLSPFDDSDLFRIPYVIADPDRHRLLFLLYQKPGQLIYYASAMIPPSETTNGLWEYDLKSKKYKRHRELYFEAFLWGSPIRDGHLLLAKAGNHRTGVVDFDLATNKIKVLWAMQPLGPDLHMQQALRQDDYYPFAFPKLARGEWIWNAHPLSRASTAKHRYEILPALGVAPPLGTTDSGLSIDPIGTDQLLVSVPSGIWLLTLQD